MIRKQFVIFGLGRFGESVARALSEAGSEVMAIDVKEDLVQEASLYATQAIKADMTDVEVMRSLGIGDMDAAIVAVASNMESSIMATILAKEAGVPYVIAKANSEMHAKILKKVGEECTEVIIAGKVFTLSGYESEEYLQKVANYLNNKYNEYNKLPSFKRQSIDTQNILMQLNIADDYFKAKKQISLIEDELQRKEKELYDLKHELVSAQMKLENLSKNSNNRR